MNISEINNIFLKKIILSSSIVKDEQGQDFGLNLKFKNISADEIYITSSKSVVHLFPEELKEEGINLKWTSIIELMSAFSNVLSTYLFSLRKDLGDLSYIIKCEDGYSIRITISKHFFRKENVGKTKIFLSILYNDEDFGNVELLELQLTKRDVLIVFNIVSELMSNINNFPTIYISANKIDTETEELISETKIPVKKHFTSLLIGDSWLHGQELFNLIYAMNKMIFGFHIEEVPQEILFSYRQIYLTFKNGIFYIQQKKLNENAEEEDMIDTYTGKKYKLEIQMSSYNLTLFYLLLNIKMLSDFEKGDSLLNFDSQSIFAEYNDIKYHISMKESLIGIGYRNSKKHGESLSFAAVVKDGAYGYETESGDYIANAFLKDGQSLPILHSFHINLKDQWEKLIESLSICYTGSYLEHSDFYIKKFFTTQFEINKFYKYEFIISSSKDNKAKAVIVVNKYLMNKGENDLLISSFRQPLFQKYLFQLLIISLNVTSYFNKNSFIINIMKNEIIRYKYSSLKKVVNNDVNKEISYGFERNGRDLKWGVISDKNLNNYLSESDVVLLYISSLARLLTGKWLPFVGEKIAIGPDGFLTDIFGEFNLEKNPGDGESWAANIFYTTNIDSEGVFYD